MFLPGERGVVAVQVVGHRLAGGARVTRGQRRVDAGVVGGGPVQTGRRWLRRVGALPISPLDWSV